MARDSTPQSIQNRSVNEPPSPITIRAATPADVDAIVRVINAAFKVERFFIDRDRTDADTVCERMQKGNFLLAEDPTRALAGCVYVEVRGDRGYFGLLAVDPTRQKSGLGKLLVAELEDHFRRAGCHWSEMRIVNLRSELPAFYHRLGYVETGTLPFTAPVAPKLHCHFIVMSKKLD
jgi:predicted N-acetyltransferase YhbS